MHYIAGKVNAGTSVVSDVGIGHQPCHFLDRPIWYR